MHDSKVENNSGEPVIRVLVTGAGGGIGQGIIKSVRRINDLDIRVVAADMSPLATGLYAADHAHLVPAATSDEYFDSIVNICLGERIDYYFPGTDIELGLCANNRDRIEKKAGTKVVVCPPKVVEIADDKYLTFRFLRDHGFYAPDSWLPSDFDYKGAHYPVVVKPRVGYRSIGVHVVNDERQLISALNSTTDPLIQQYLAAEDEEYTCTIVVAEGSVSDVVVLKRVLRAGDTFQAQPIESPEISSYVRNVAVALGVEGSCNFQLRLHDGVPKIFEINSRFSGTTPFCTLLGFNPVEFYLKSRLGRAYRYTIDYGVMVLRHWTEVVVEMADVDRLTREGASHLRAVSVSRLIDD